MEQPKETTPWWQPALEVFGQISGWIVGPIVIALVVGKKLDSHFGTKPWIFIGLSILSFSISSFGMVRTINQYAKKLEKENDATRNQPK